MPLSRRRANGVCFLNTSDPAIRLCAHSPHRALLSPLNHENARYHRRMARKIVHQLVDDLDGTVLEPGEGETVLFALDGKSYEIDLTAQNAQSLRDAFTKYIDAARRMSSGGSGNSAAARGRRRTGQTDYGPIREWAKENGYTVSERGRVPATIIDAYEAAH